MTSPIPGLPSRYGDPGVFVCGPQDIAPWEQQAPAVAVPRPAPAPRRTGWLVLALCPVCRRAGRYCDNHDARNFWVTVFGPQRKWRR